MALAFLGGTLIHGTGQPPQQDAAVVLDGARVSWTGPEQNVVVPPKAHVVETQGKTIMPGMIDAHVHICNDTEPNPMSKLADTIPLTSIRGVVAARAILDSGFTTCRNLGSLEYADVAVKQAIEKGLVPGPRLVVSGEMVVSVGTGEDGYLRPGIQVPRSGVVCGVDEARRAVRTQIYHGADVIKLIASGRVGSNACSMPWHTEMTRDEMAAVVDEAHRWGKRVAAHAYSAQTVTDCVLAGVDSIEHGVLIDEPTMALMADRGTALVPTMTPFHNFLVPGAEERFPDYYLERGRPMAETQRANIPSYLEYGIRIAVGSDGPNPGSLPGTTALELELMVNAGMTPMQAIESATRVGAEVLGLSDDLGTLEPGKLADLVVVDGDPLSDIRILQDRERIQVIVKGGEIVRSVP